MAAPVTRTRTHPCRYKYVRRAGLVYQARVWLPAPVGSVNLGLFKTEAAANQAVQAWLRAGADPCRALPAGVLPKWVYADGDAFGWRVKLGGAWHGGGPFAAAAVAHEAARRAVLGRPDRPGKPGAGSASEVAAAPKTPGW